MLIILREKSDRARTHLYHIEQLRKTAAAAFFFAMTTQNANNRHTFFAEVRHCDESLALGVVQTFADGFFGGLERHDAAPFRFAERAVVVIATGIVGVLDLSKAVRYLRIMIT